MPNDVELRLRRALEALPGSSRASAERARLSALAVLPEQAARPRARRLVIAAVLGAAVLALATAVALAGSGRLHVTLGAPVKPAPRPPAHLVLPRGSSGLSVLAGGRLWVVTRGGVRVEGLPASAAALSPRALYVAVGLGRSLVALAPRSRRAWAQPTDGPVVAAAWAPDGLEIAYVVAVTPRRYELRMIEGNGIHDRALVNGVAPLVPSWRADSLALAYIDRRGRAAVEDFARGKSYTLPFSLDCGGPLRAVAFAPTSRRVAAISANGVLVFGVASHPSCLPFESVISLTGLTWLGGRGLVTVERSTVGSASYLRRFALGPTGTVREAGFRRGLAPFAAVAAQLNARALAVARLSHRRLEIALVSAPGEPASDALLLAFPSLPRAAALGWR